MRAPERALNLPSGLNTVFGFGVGDLDGDGIADLMAGASGGSAVGRGVGGRVFAVGSGPATAGDGVPFLRDFDGDGVLDACWIRREPGIQPIRLALHRAAGWQVPASPLPPYYSGVILGADIGDLDGDGDLDLVVSPTAAVGGALVVLRNDGAGSFAVEENVVQQGLPVGMWPQLGDLDRDGDADIVASVPGGGLVLLRNDGTRFTNLSATLPPFGGACALQVLRDLDADGWLDIVTIDLQGSIAVWWGAGMAFAPATGVASLPSGRALVATDAEGDGDLDLVVERPGTGFEFLRNLGGRQFRREDWIAQPAVAFGVGDLDGDGIDELVFTTSLAPRLVQVASIGEPWAIDGIYLGQDAVRIPGGDALYKAFDADGDGRTDVLALAQDSYCYLANGDGTYRRTSLPPGPCVQAIAVDVDLDEDLDVVAKISLVTVVLRNQGGGVFVREPVQSSLGALRVGDVDGDGYPDIVAVALSRFRLELLRNLGDGTFAPPTKIVDNQSNGDIELLDLDGDGDLDLATTVEAAAAVSSGRSVFLLLENDGHGEFAPYRCSYDAVFPTRLGHADLDGDGDQDLVAITTRARWFRNDGATLVEVGTLADGSLVPLAHPIYGDFDEDGDVDFLSLAGQLVENDGAGSFSIAPTHRISSLATDLIEAVDFDDDGDVDLLGRSIQVNHQRQLRIDHAPHIGGSLEVLVFSGPGFSAPGVALVGFAAARATTPIDVPGMRGKLQLDPASFTLAANVATSVIGTASAFLSVPNELAIVGMEVWLQGLIAPQGGAIGWTNAEFERVLR